VIGLIVIGAIAVYIAAAWLIISKTGTPIGRVAVGLLAIAIPFWEFPIGYWNLLRQCKNEGGNHISKDFQPSPSIALDFTFHQRPRELMTLGFHIVEYSSGDKFTRFTRNGDGMTESIHDSSISQLTYRREIVKELPWNLDRYDDVIVRKKDGATVARQTDFRWRGMWWEDALNARVTPGTRCAGVGGIPLVSVLPQFK
jgi:hypothetical protein